MSEVFCSICGAENPQESLICQGCGADLEVPAPATPEEDSASGDSDFFMGMEDDDLPGLLHTLKEEQQEESPEGLEVVGPADGSVVDDPGLFPEDQMEEQEIPDWLHRVRQRAREEDDAVGDLIRRTDAQQENLRPENRDARHESFEAWMERLRSQARDKAKGSPEDIFDLEGAEDTGEETEPEWLARIRAEQRELPAVDGVIFEPVDGPEVRNLPDWLTNLSGQNVPDKASEPEPQSLEKAVEEPPPIPEERMDGSPGEEDLESPTVVEDRPVEKTSGADSAPLETEAQAVLPDEFGGDRTEKMHPGYPSDGRLDGVEGAPEVDVSVQRNSQEEDVETGAEVTRQIFPPPSLPDQEVTREIRAFAFGEGVEDWLAAHTPATASGATPEKLSPLEITPKQKEQAELLAALIADECTSRPSEVRRGRSSAWLLRLAIGLLLVLALAFSLFNDEIKAVPALPLEPSVDALLSGLVDLPLDARVLLIFDVQPGFFGELQMVAGPVLSELVQEGRVIYTAASSVSAPLISRQILLDVMDEKGLSLSDNAIIDLGYFPVDTYGHSGMTAALGNLEAPSGFPSPAKKLAAGRVDAVFLIADQFESARLWMEQLGTLAPNRPVYLLVTAQAGPMLSPYWESGQAAGLVSGITDTVALESKLVQPGSGTRRWQAYQAGVLLIAALLAIGLIFGLERSSDSHRRGGS